MRPIILAALIIGLASCSDDTIGVFTSASSSGGGGGNTSTATSTATVTGTGGSGGSCAARGALACADFVDTSVYPDPLLAYITGTVPVGPLGAFPDESPTGAAAGRIGPFTASITISSIVVSLGFVIGSCQYPAIVRTAVWVEPQCGLPTKDPVDFYEDHVLSGLAQENVGTAVIRVTIPLSKPVPAIKGDSAYVALVFTNSEVCTVAYQQSGQTSVRAMWFGRGDNDCDGETDLAHEWFYLSKPTAPDVLASSNDLGFGIVAQ